jgi:hypothetical protein
VKLFVALYTQHVTLVSVTIYIYKLENLIEKTVRRNEPQNCKKVVIILVQALYKNSNINICNKFFVDYFCTGLELDSLRAISGI